MCYLSQLQELSFAPERSEGLETQCLILGRSGIHGNTKKKEAASPCRGGIFSCHKSADLSIHMKTEQNKAKERCGNGRTVSYGSRCLWAGSPVLQAVPSSIQLEVQEIRFRAGRPISLSLPGRTLFLTGRGDVVRTATLSCFLPSQSVLEDVFSACALSPCIVTRTKSETDM